MNTVLIAIILLLSSSAMAADIPDAPSVAKESTTCEQHGKPCPEWLHKMIGQYPPTTRDLMGGWCSGQGAIL